MSYTKHTWQTGDVVSVARLNNIEDGVASAGGMVRHINTNGTLDASYNDLLAEVNAGKLPYLYASSTYPCVVLMQLDSHNGYCAYFGKNDYFVNSVPDEPMFVD